MNETRPAPIAGVVDGTVQTSVCADGTVVLHIALGGSDAARSGSARIDVYLDVAEGETTPVLALVRAAAEDRALPCRVGVHLPGSTSRPHR